MRYYAVKPLVHLFPSALHRPLNPNFLSPRTSLSFPSKTQTLAFLSPRRAMTATANPPPSVHVRETIELNSVEKELFDRLIGTLEHFGLQNQLRVAGGWVRDKLLGKECKDIDIALDDMLGSEFASKVEAYLLSIGKEAPKIAIISSNPEQSKHLETARMRIGEVWIDFTNLRCEEYCENSRIPTMKFGTPKEDAYRRDLTINSLFYNINTNSVEDFTERGIEDLKCGRIKTPLPPKSTFMDDPLRVLRAIRFGARFEFTIDEELKKAASSEDVKAALATKISRERIGVEIELMISGNQPVKAMSYISDLMLFEVVFSLPSNLESGIPEGCDRLCVAYLDAYWNLIQLVGRSSFNDQQRKLSLYGAMFLPFRKITYKDKKSKSVPLVHFFLRDSLKGKVSDAETVVTIHTAVEKFMSLLPVLALNKDISEIECGTEFPDVPNSSKLQVMTGLALRQVKDFWRVALLMATLLYKVDSDEDTVINKSFQLDTLGDLFKVAEKRIIELGLEHVWDVKPLVNGKEIMDILQLQTGGPLVREWQYKLLVWQLAHPTGTSEECMEWMSETNSKRAKTVI